MTGIFVVASPEVRTSRSGEDYLRLTLRDEDRDSIDALFFGVPDDLATTVESGQTYEITGRAEEFRGRVNIKLTSMELAEPQWDPVDLLPQGDQDASVLGAIVSAAVESIDDRNVRAVVQSVLEAPVVVERISKWPAAKARHHAWVGGLLEHTVEMLRLAERVCETFPGLNHDLLVAGVILHDLGKVLELEISADFDYTSAGNLEGHMVHGVRLLDEAISQNECEAEVAMLLRHLVLSHQGTLAFSAVVEPMIPEAIALHFIDQLSSQIRPAIEDLKAARARGAQGTTIRGPTSMRHLYVRTGSDGAADNGI